MHRAKGKSERKKNSTCSAASRREEESVPTRQSAGMAEVKALLEKLIERIEINRAGEAASRKVP